MGAGVSNTDRKFHRRWARESGIPWAKVVGRYRGRTRHPRDPVKFDVIRDDRVGRKKARQGGVVDALLSMAAVFGFARRRT